MENKRLNNAANYIVYIRNYQRARTRAMTRLAKAYPDEYKELFEEEKLNDYTQGKTWIDIHGNTSSNMDANASSDTARDRDTPPETNHSTRTGNL